MAACALCHQQHDDDRACPPLPRETLASQRLGYGRRSFLAKYAGVCPSCQEFIQVNDSIVTHEGEAIHEECAP